MPDLNPHCLTLIIFLKEFFGKVDFEKNQQMTKKREKFLSGQRVKMLEIKEQFDYFRTTSVSGWSREGSTSLHPGAIRETI